MRSYILPYTSVFVVPKGIQFIFLQNRTSRDSFSQISFFPSCPNRAISNACRPRKDQSMRRLSNPTHLHRKSETQRVRETHPGSHSSMKAKLSPSPLLHRIISSNGAESQKIIES